ncbi:Alpha-ketoglutarate-dependent dioxygenase AlkB [Balamuthia mandrillaris]
MKQTQITAFVSRSPTKRKKESAETDEEQASEEVEAASTKRHKGKEIVPEEVEETKKEPARKSTTRKANIQRKEISEGCFVSFCPGYLSPSKASELFQELLELPNFIQGQFKIFGKSINTPRIDGKDYIGFHADKEGIPEGKNKIASLSLGATRRFLMKQYTEKKASLEYVLTPGSIILMEGETQRHWKHSVPKETKCTQPRINLTFRIA